MEHDPDRSNCGNSHEGKQHKEGFESPILGSRMLFLRYRFSRLACSDDDARCRNAPLGVTRVDDLENAAVVVLQNCEGYWQHILGGVTDVALGELGDSSAHPQNASIDYLA